MRRPVGGRSGRPRPGTVHLPAGELDLISALEGHLADLLEAVVDRVADRAADHHEVLFGSSVSEAAHTTKNA